MKLVIVSDSHGSSRALRAVFDRFPSADCFIHLGDGLAEFDALRTDYPNVMFCGVRGNCDGAFAGGDGYGVGPEVLSLGGKRIMLTHGSAQGVAFGLERLFFLAASKRCDIVLYGHTHCRANNYSDEIYFFNPGSAARPRDGLASSFGLIEIRDNGVLLSHGEV